MQIRSLARRGEGGGGGGGGPKQGAGDGGGSKARVNVSSRFIKKSRGIEVDTEQRQMRRH